MDIIKIISLSPYRNQQERHPCKKQRKTQVNHLCNLKNKLPFPPKAIWGEKHEHKKCIEGWKQLILTWNNFILYERDHISLDFYRLPFRLLLKNKQESAVWRCHTNVLEIWRIKNFSKSNSERKHLTESVSKPSSSPFLLVVASCKKGIFWGVLLLVY